MGRGGSLRSTSAAAFYGSDAGLGRTTKVWVDIARLRQQKAGMALAMTGLEGTRRARWPSCYWLFSSCVDWESKFEEAYMDRVPEQEE